MKESSRAASVKSRSAHQRWPIAGAQESPSRSRRHERHPHSRHCSCLQMSRRTVGRNVSHFANDGLNALVRAMATKPKDDPEREQFPFSLLHAPRPLTGLTEPRGGWMIFTELWLNMVIARRENVYLRLSFTTAITVPQKLRRTQSIDASRRGTTSFFAARSVPDERYGGRSGYRASSPKPTTAKIRSIAESHSPIQP